MTAKQQNQRWADEEAREREAEAEAIWREERPLEPYPRRLFEKDRRRRIQDGVMHEAFTTFAVIGADSVRFNSAAGVGSGIGSGGGGCDRVGDFEQELEMKFARPRVSAGVFHGAGLASHVIRTGHRSWLALLRAHHRKSLSD